MPCRSNIVQTPEGNLFQPIDIRIRRQGAEVQFAYARLVPGEYELHVDTTAVTDRAGNPLGDSTDEIVLQFTVIDADIVWINDGVAFWDDINNWDTGQLPKPGDEVFLSGPDTAKAIYRTGTNSIKSLKGDMEFELQGGTLEVEQIKLDNTITLNGGGIRNAHILPGAAGQGITALNNGSNHLDSVRLDANLNLTTNNAVVTIYNQLTLNSTATIGYRARIDFPGSQTLTGTGTVVYATDEFYNRQGLRSTTNYSTFIIDAGITIRGGGGYIGYSEGWQGGSSTSTIINRGTIQADVSGRTIRINPVSGSFLNEGMIAATNGAILDVNALQGQIGESAVTGGGHLDLDGTYTNELDRAISGILSLGGDWTNTAVLTINGGATLNLGGSFDATDIGTLDRQGGTVNLTGTLNNQGTTLALNATTGGIHLRGGRINGGVVSGQSLIGTDSNGTLDGVTLDTDLDLTPNNSVVTVQNNLTLNGTATIGYRARIDWPGSQTLTGTGTVVYATSEFYNRQGLRITSDYSTFIIDSGITIRGGGGYIGYSEGWHGGSSTSIIINRGTIQSDVAGRTIRINPFNGSFLNEGTLAVTGGGTLDVDALKDSIGIASATAGGHLDIDGTFNTPHPNFMLTPRTRSVPPRPLPAVTWTSMARSPIPGSDAGRFHTVFERHMDECGDTQLDQLHAEHRGNLGQRRHD